jgi:hypothetical protein
MREPMRREAESLMTVVDSRRGRRRNVGRRPACRSEEDGYRSSRLPIQEVRMPGYVDPFTDRRLQLVPRGEEPDAVPHWPDPSFEALLDDEDLPDADLEETA